MLPVGLGLFLEWDWLKPRLTSESHKVKEYCVFEYLLSLGRLGEKRGRLLKWHLHGQYFFSSIHLYSSFCIGQGEAVRLCCVRLCAVAPPVSISR